MVYRCTECGGRVGMTPENWQCINMDCRETWDRLSDDSTDTDDGESEPPTEDRVPEDVRLQRRKKRRREQARAYRKRHGLDRK